MNLRKVVSVIAYSALLTGSVFASGFVKENLYTSDLFTDVESTAWYAKEVQSTYELGLMNGKGGGLFAPDGLVSVAEAVTMASRAYSVYNGEDIPEVTGAEWYDKYINFAVSKGIMKNGDFDDYNRAAKRFEVALLFENAMPDGYFTKVNNVDSVPDIPDEMSYSDALITLYNAGVVMGSDAYGNFFPENNITRAEAAAIITRVAIPENILKKSLDKISDDDAYELIITRNFNGSKEGIASGWQLDNRGGYPRNKLAGGYTILTDISDTEGTALIRDINPTDTGKITFDYKLTISGDGNGVYISFDNTDDVSMLKLIKDEKGWNSVQNDGSKKLLFESNEKSFVFKTVLDIDNGRSNIYINGTDCGTVSFSAASNKTLSRLVIGTDEKCTTGVSLAYVMAYANYTIHDDFIYSDINKLPDGWNGVNSVVSSASSLKIGAKGNVSKSFVPVSDRVVGEFTAAINENTSFTYYMNSGAKSVATLGVDGKSIVFCGNSVYEYVPGMWYRFRIEADTVKMMATVKINGRKIAEVPFIEKSTSVDNILVVNNADIDTETDDYKLFSVKDREDYVPVPVKCAGDDKYNIGINVCSLWQNGVQNGWSCISPYSDIEPVLGYYDEGNPETADWEIKYMVEHGIDFQAFCWFADKTNQPLKAPTNSVHLHDGFMNAKYSDMMSYSLIWEAVNGLRPSNLDSWKKFYVPYLIENYFKDERYMKIDNMPVFIVFGAAKLAEPSCFGHADAVKEAFDYLEQEVKKLGFDGMIYLSCGEASTMNIQMGFDGNYAYSWGYEGYSVNTNITGNLRSAEIMYTVPTVSVGFNNVGWEYTRRPLMNISDYKTVNEWVRDEYLPKYGEKGTWKESFVMLSTWNEYGEGTYIMPCEGLHGFDYLDTIREVYTDEKADVGINTIPTPEQKKRITRLYPQNLHLLRKEGYITKKSYDEYEVVHRVDVTDKNVVLEGVTSQPDDYKFTGITTNNDPKVMVNLGTNLELDNIQAVRIRMAVPQASTIQMFFTTVAESAASSDKGATQKADSDGMTEYIFDFSENEKWSGKLTLFLRIDPVSAPDVKFSIESVEFLSSGETASKMMIVDEKEYEMNFPYEISDNGEILFAFDPSIAMDYIFGAYHTWDKDEKSLTVNVNGHTLVYTVGKNTCFADGKEKNLGFALYEKDGLPMLPLESFCSDAGFSYYSSPDGSGAFIIITHQKPFLDSIADTIANRTEGTWEFDVMGDTELWNSSNMSLSSVNGVMTAVNSTSGSDPSIIYGGKISLSTERYTRLELKVKYKYTAQAPSAIHMYYITDTDKTWNEEKAIYLRLNSMDSGDSFETYTADLGELPKWVGNVTGLRLDPFNANGTMEFEYIKFLEDDNYVHVDPENVPFSLVGGDAENIKGAPFFSENANITLVSDPENDENTCYLVMSRGGNAYCYFQQKVYFKPGKTYKVEFDVRLAAHDSNTDLADDFKAAICCNFRYVDPKGRDHVVGNVRPTASEGWVHFSKEYTVDENCTDRSGDQFTIYSNPVNNLGVGYYIDNIKVTEVN